MMATEPRPYGRQPTALRSLAEDIERKLERELRAALVELSTVAVKAYWLRAESGGYGYPDYTRAYIWIAPTLMSPALCEHIEQLVGANGGGRQHRPRRWPKADEANPLRPFVYAVIDLEQRQPAGLMSRAPELNARQRAYLQAIFNTDQVLEADMRHPVQPVS